MAYKIKNGKLYKTSGGKDFLISNSVKYSQQYTKKGKFVNKPQPVEGEYIIDGEGYSIAPSNLDKFIQNLPEKKQGFSFNPKKYKQVGNQILLKYPQYSGESRIGNKVFVVTRETAPLVNRKEIQKFNARLNKRLSPTTYISLEGGKNRLIRPLRPIKTIKNLGKRIDLLNRAETLQRNLETKELRAYARENKPLKSFGRQSAIFGLSFATETIRGVKGIIALPKNVIKTIPKLPRLAVNLVRDRKNIIPMAKLRFKSFKNRQGYLLKTSPSTFFGKVGANIFLFKASGKGLQFAGKLSKPATSKISRYLPKFTKKQRLIFQGVQVQRGNKIYSTIVFKSGKKIYGFAVGVGKIGKKGKLVLSNVVGRAYKLKSFPYLRKQPLNTKKVISFASRDIGKTMIVNGVRTLYVNKGVTIQKAIKNIIQVNAGKSAQVLGKKFYKNVIVFPTGQIRRIKVKGITNRDFVSVSRIFTKKDLSIIVGQSRTKSKEIINFLGRIKTLRNKGGTQFISTTGLRTISKKNLVNIAGALSTGVVNGRKILNKLSPMARKVINNNIKAGLVLIPKLDLSKIKAGVPSVSAKSFTTSLSGLETPTSSGLRVRSRQVPRHIDYFKPIVNIVSRTKTNQIVKNKSVGKQQEKLISVLKSPTAQREIQRLAPRQKERLRQYLRQYLRFYPNMRIPLVRVIPFGFIVKSKTKVKRTPNYRNLKTGWVVYGYSQGAYRRLNKKPLSKMDALSRGAYAIDRTTAKTFKIVPIPNVKNFGRLIKREKGYFTLTKPKFREYKIQKGNRKFITYTLIEKRRFGIDTRGEMKGLSLYRYLAKLKKSGKY